MNLRELKTSRKHAILISGVFISFFAGFPLQLLQAADNQMVPMERQQAKKAHAIKGVVLDEKTGDPIIGASIKVVGTAVGIVSDLDGNYTLSVPSTATKIDIADPITYMKMHNEAVTTRNPMAAQPYSQEKIDNTIAGTNPYVYPAVILFSVTFCA